MKNISMSLILALAACGPQASPDKKSTTAPGTNEPDPGGGVPVDPISGTDGSSSAPSGAPIPPVVKSCLDVCTSKHPVGVKLSAAIDTCWAANCKNACLFAGEPSGKVVGPNLVTTDGGTCATQVLTPFEPCSTCTVSFCCASWDKAFTDPDALALNECTNACWGK